MIKHLLLVMVFSVIMGCASQSIYMIQENEPKGYLLIRNDTDLMLSIRGFEQALGCTGLLQGPDIQPNSELRLPVRADIESAFTLAAVKSERQTDSSYIVTSCEPTFSLKAKSGAQYPVLVSLKGKNCVAELYAESETSSHDADFKNLKFSPPASGSIRESWCSE